MPAPKITPDEAKTATLKGAGRSAKSAALKVEDRDRLIRLAHLAGNSYREIAEACGMNHNTIKNIIDRGPQPWNPAEPGQRR